MEGNIGSGKSTCLEYFRKQKSVEVSFGIGSIKDVSMYI